MIRAALTLEWLKLRRSRLGWITFTLVSVGCPAITVGFMAAANRGPGDTPIALKVKAILIGEGWTAYLGMLTQILSVAAVVGAGVVVSWSFGREFTDHTVSGLFALPTSRKAIAGAKFITLTAWSIAMSCVALASALVLAPIAGLRLPTEGIAVASVKVILIGLSGGILALPLAFIGTAARGYLAAIASLILIVVVTQMITVIGLGAWFPYAIPSLWAGMGGQAAAALIRPVQLALVPAIGLAGVVATLHRWHRMEVI